MFRSSHICFCLYFFRLVFRSLVTLHVYIYVQPRPAESFFGIFSLRNWTLFGSLAFEPLTAIAFEIFEISELTKFWRLRARSFRNCRILILVMWPSSTILKRSKFRQPGDFDSVEHSELSNTLLTNLSTARRFRHCRTLGDFHSVERSEISTVSNAQSCRRRRYFAFLLSINVGTTFSCDFTKMFSNS